MRNFSQLLELASLLSGDMGATVPEIREKLDYGLRSSIYIDFENLFRHFGLTVMKDEENPKRRGREVVYRIEKEDWLNFKKKFISEVD